MVITHTINKQLQYYHPFIRNKGSNCLYIMSSFFDIPGSSSSHSNFPDGSIHKPRTSYPVDFDLGN